MKREWNTLEAIYDEKDDFKKELSHVAQKLLDECLNNYKLQIYQDDDKIYTYSEIFGINELAMNYNDIRNSN